MPTDVEKTINQEAELPDNWVPKDVKPITPGSAPPASIVGLRSELGDFYSGSLSPALQHDTNFVRTGYPIPSGAQTPLMPMAPSGTPGVNSAVQSVINLNPPTPAPAINGMRFRGVWNAYTKYSINDVVLFNISAYVAIAANTVEQPDNNTAFWTLLSENLHFDADVITPGTSGFGDFDQNARAFGANVFPATSNPTSSATPNESSGWAILLSSVVDTPTGWNNLGSAVGFSQEGLYCKTFNTAATISTNQSGAPIVRWCTNLSLFAGAGEAVTGTVSSVTIASNIATVSVANDWVVGTRVRFTGLVNATFLNNQTIIITSRTATTVTGAFTHANYGPTSDSGTATYLPYLQAVTVSLSTGTHTATPSFSSPITEGSTLMILFSANDVNCTGSINSASGGGTFTIYNESNGGGGSFAHAAIAQDVSAGSPTFSIGYTTNNSGACTMIIVELPGQGSSDTTNYLPYDVFEFRGSFFVCNTATTEDAFTDPDSWWMLAQGTGYVDELSGSFSPTILDYGRLISNATSSAYTVTLPSTPPSDSWWIALEQSGTGSIVIDPNGLTLDGSSSTLTLFQNQGLLIFTNGSSYFTVRGYAPYGSYWNTVAKSTTYTAVAGDYVLASTASGWTLTIPASSANKGRSIRVKKVSADANVLTIARSGSDTIDGATSQTITIQYNEMELTADGGTGWYIS